MVLGVLAVGLAIAVPAGARALDTLAVAVARGEAARLLAVARGEALAAGRATAVTVDAAGGRLVAHAGTDTVARALFGPAGIALHATRDSMAYGPDGLGAGAANLRIILRRGHAADTLSVSRLGRVRAGG